MKQTLLHPADSRGKASHGWLQSFHSFSFANYYNPDRMNFGALRVLNDDTVAPSRGFGTHPHDNMEIISIPLSGDLEHKDSMGNTQYIRHGDVQVMSAGTGIFHSEYNANNDRPVKFLQIWVIPNQRNVQPRYQQLTLNLADRKNRLQQIVGPKGSKEGLWIYQDAWFSLGELDLDFELDYKLHNSENGVYAFVIKGSVQIDDTILLERDGMGIWNIDKLTVKSLSPGAELLLMELPMR